MPDGAPDVEDVMEYRLDGGWRERGRERERVSRTCSHWAGWATDRAVIECQPACAEGHIRENGLNVRVQCTLVCVDTYLCLRVNVGERNLNKLQFKMQFKTNIPFLRPLSSSYV